MSIDQRTEQQKEIDRRVKSRVIRGITMLEEHYGPDWADKIDLNRLDLASAQSCVLGQIYHEFDTGVKKVWGSTNDVSYAKAKEAGFLMDSEFAQMLSADGVLDDSWGYYTYLTEAWRDEIRSRRAAR